MLRPIDSDTDEFRSPQKPSAPLPIDRAQEDRTMKTLAGIGIVALLVLAGCSTETKTVEQSTAPSAGAAAPMAYPAHNMVEFDTAMASADDHCYKQENLMRAHYVDRTPDEAHFTCAAR